MQNQSIAPVKKIDARESIKGRKKENLAKRLGIYEARYQAGETHHSMGNSVFSEERWN